MPIIINQPFLSISCVAWRQEVQGLGEGLGPEIGPSLAKAISVHWDGCKNTGYVRSIGLEYEPINKNNLDGLIFFFDPLDDWV